MQSVALFKTDSAHRHLDALCRHFGRKVAVQFGADTGWVQFPFGRCDMTADANQLELIATAEDANALDLVTDVVTRHLERYAFREHPRLDWRASNASDPTNPNESS